MTVALKVLVLYLLTELTAHTLIVLCPIDTARAIATRSFKALFYRSDDFFVFIKSYFHISPYLLSVISFTSFSFGT